MRSIRIVLALVACLLGGCPSKSPPVDAGDLGGQEAGPREARPQEAGTCGNNRAEGSEGCDGGDLRGQSCLGLGLIGGTLRCTAACRFDFGGCASCGNGKLDGPEECDKVELKGETCTSRGFTGGKLQCGPSCVLDTSQCTKFAPGHATLIYGTATTLAAQTMDTATGVWSTPWSAPVVGSPRWVVNRVSPTDPQDEIAAATTDNGAAGQQLHLLRKAGAWSIDKVETLALPADAADKRVFDIAYESTSGEALAVYSNDTNNPQYSTYSKAAGWSAASNVFGTTPPPGAGKVRWVVLASQPNTSQPSTNEVVLVYSDFNAGNGQWNAYTVTWDGGKFLEQKAEAITDPSDADHPGLGRDTQAFDAAYEHKSGDLMIVASNACCSCIGAAVRLAGTTTFDGPSNDACAHWTFMRLAAQRGGDGIVLAGDWGSAVIWSGSVFNVEMRQWDGPQQPGEVAWADAAWVGSQPVAIAVQRGWPDANPGGGVGNIQWLRSTTGATWQKPTPFAVAGMKDVTRVQLEAFPAEDRVLGALADSAKSLWVVTYDMSGAWVVTNSKAPVVKNQLATPDTRVFSIAIKQ